LEVRPCRPFRGQFSASAFVDRGELGELIVECGVLSIALRKQSASQLTQDLLVCVAADDLKQIGVGDRTYSLAAGRLVPSCYRWAVHDNATFRGITLKNRGLTAIVLDASGRQLASQRIPENSSGSTHVDILIPPSIDLELEVIDRYGKPYAYCVLDILFKDDRHARFNVVADRRGAAQIVLDESVWGMNPTLMVHRPGAVDIVEFDFVQARIDDDKRKVFSIDLRKQKYRREFYLSGNREDIRGVWAEFRDSSDGGLSWSEPFSPIVISDDCGAISISHSVSGPKTIDVAIFRP
jgi:hypothetical protein